MENIDEKIREALKETKDSEMLLSEQSLFKEAMAPFRGRRKWVNYVGLLYGVVGFTAFIWGAIEFYHAEVVREQLLWGGLALLGIMFNAFMKVFFWFEMHTSRVLRELKRVELLILQDDE